MITKKKREAMIKAITKRCISVNPRIGEVLKAIEKAGNRVAITSEGSFLWWNRKRDAAVPFANQTDWDLHKRLCAQADPTIDLVHQLLINKIAR